MLYSVVNILVCTLLILILLVLSVILVIYKVKFRYWQKRNVYTQKPTIPFGNAKDAVLQKSPFGFSVNDFYKELKNKSLRYGGYYFLHKPVFVPADINLIKKIFVSDFEYFCDRVSHVDQGNDPLSANLLHLTGHRWKIIRAILRPFITSKPLKKGYPSMKQFISTLLLVIDETVNKEGSVDIKEVLDRFNIDLIGAYFFKVDSNTMKKPDNAFKRNITNFFNSSFKDSLIRLTISLPAVIKFCKIKTFNSEVTTFFTHLVDSLLKDKSNHESKDILNALTSSSVPLTKSEIIANSAILYLAGYDTTSNTATFCLYELALNKNLQDDVRDEIKTIIQKHGGELTYFSLKELILLEKCLKEALRKYPMGIITSRICRKDYRVPDSDLVLSRGTHVYLPIRGIHWDSEFYPNPEMFDPERFEGSSCRPPCTWIPYGSGPRHCIGYKMANLLMKLTLAALLVNYEILLHPSTECPIQYDRKAFMLQPNTPIRLIVNKV